MKNEKSPLPLGRGVEILNTHPLGVLALCKPAGVLSHPNKPGENARALLTWPYDAGEECFVSPAKDERVWLLNRLDSGTSGVLLCATKQETAELIQRLFAENQVHKKYYALTFGTMHPPTQQWRDRLAVERRKGQLRTSAKGGAPAETQARLARRFPGLPALSLLELEPKTGRTHQLRVQCAKRNLPIVGDRTYGKFSWNRDFARRTGITRLLLHSAKVSFSASLKGERFSFVARAPLPPEFTRK